MAYAEYALWFPVIRVVLISSMVESGVAVALGWKKRVDRK